MKSIRTRKIGVSLQKAISTIVKEDLKDPRINHLIAITEVDVSPDLSTAKVFVSILEDDKHQNIILTLNKASKFIRHQLKYYVDLRVTPKLNFYFDDSIIQGRHIANLINQSI